MLLISKLAAHLLIYINNHFRYTNRNYSVFKNNCNDFTEETAKFLTGKGGLPRKILGRFCLTFHLLFHTYICDKSFYIETSNLTSLQKSPSSSIFWKHNFCIDIECQYVEIGDACHLKINIFASFLWFRLFEWLAAVAVVMHITHCTAVEA